MSRRKQRLHRKPEPKLDPAVQFYHTVGEVFAVCGICSALLLGFVSLLPQDHDKYNIPLFFGIWLSVSALLLALGTVLVILSRKSIAFQKWVQKDMKSFAMRHLEKEIKKAKPADRRRM